jgi:hypothetical protein
MYLLEKIEIIITKNIYFYYKKHKFLFKKILLLFRFLLYHIYFWITWHILIINITHSIDLIVNTSRFNRIFLSQNCVVSDSGLLCWSCCKTVELLCYTNAFNLYDKKVEYIAIYECYAILL